MNIQRERHDGFTLARLTGRSDESRDAAVAEMLRDMVPGAGGVLAIDLSGVDMISSSGLGLLVDLTARARVREARVVLIAPSPFVEGVLKVTKLDQWLEVASSINELERE